MDFGFLDPLLCEDFVFETGFVLLERDDAHAVPCRFVTVDSSVGVTVDPQSIRVSSIHVGFTGVRNFLRLCSLRLRSEEPIGRFGGRSNWSNGLLVTHNIRGPMTTVVILFRNLVRGNLKCLGQARIYD